MASLPGLLRSTLRTRLASTPCSCTRPFSSSLSFSKDDRRNPSNGSEGPPRFGRADYDQGSSSSSSRPRHSSPGSSNSRQNERPPSSSQLDTSKTRFKPRGPPRKGRGPRRPTQDDPRLPTKSRLPPEDPPPTVADLDPELLHEYRLTLMTQIARVPSPKELEDGLPAWLRKERTKEAAEVSRAFSKVAKAEQTAEKLDVAWEWQRRADEMAGKPRTEDQQRKDRAVRARVLEQARLRAEEKEQERQRRLERQEGGPPTPRTKEAMDGSRDGLSKRRDSARKGRTEQRPGQAAEEEDEPRNPPAWLKHRRTIKDKFPEGWAPPKRISREASELLRILQRSDPTVYTTPTLADRFKISPEAVRRILKSQFELSPEEKNKREQKRLRAEAEKRMAEGEEGHTWAGDKVGERGEMRKLRTASAKEQGSKGDGKGEGEGAG